MLFYDLVACGLSVFHQHGAEGEGMEGARVQEGLRVRAFLGHKRKVAAAVVYCQAAGAGCIPVKDAVADYYTV